MRWPWAQTYALRPRKAGSHLDQQRHGAIVRQCHGHPGAEDSPLRSQRCADALVERLGFLGRGRVHEARAVALPDVAVEGELADAQDVAPGVTEREVHLPLGVLEDPK